MTTMGIRAGDVVLVIEHSGERVLVHNALVLSFSMDQRLAGTHGEPAVQACFVERRAGGSATLRAHDVVHTSHRDFRERASLGYEELPDEEVVAVLRVMLDQVDYTSSACSLNKMVGSVLPEEILDRAKVALRRM